MVWAKLDDAILDNPKIAKAGVLGFALHVAAITWCCRNLSDGFVPYARARSLLDFSDLDVEFLCATPGPEGTHDSFHDAIHNVGKPELTPVAQRLVGIGLWREDAEKGGYWVHDFLEYNPSREQHLAERAAKSEAGKSGADKRWGNGGRRPRAIAPAMGAAMAPAIAERWQSDGRPDGTSMAERCPDPDPDPVPVPLNPFIKAQSTAVAEPPSDTPPGWFATAVDVITMSTGVTLPVAEAWLRYSGHRAGKAIAPNKTDAQYWLTTVMVPEVREVARKASRETNRDDQFRRDKLGVAPKAQDSRKLFKERDVWAAQAGAPDPEAQARLDKLLGKVGT